ncbi:MAG TPA: hypothetical protein VFN74_18900 [Chloroflexota bacterium]|nr:hypothetical protein [Chloroflexota bacterium]
MDEATGLLDRLSNPRPAQVVARTLNTALFAAPPGEPYRAEAAFECDAGRVLTLTSGGARWSLVLPRAESGGDNRQLVARVLGGERASAVKCLHLAEGTSEVVEPSAGALREALGRAPGPVLFIASA